MADTMTTGVSFERDLAEQAGRAAERVAGTTEQRRDHVELLGEQGGMALADAPERVAARIDRLARYVPDVQPVSPSRLIAGEPAAVAAAGRVLERVIGTKDFIPVRYLEAGTIAARAVARVDIRDDRGRVVGYGTGSLVSPELLLTNHHVLRDAGVAACSAIELNHQDGIDGRPLAPVLFGLDPQRLFLADEDLDYALVAVRATPAELAPFGFNRIIEAEGKAIVGDFVTIVQHPGGERKQVALRENRILGLLDKFLHYEADTEPGSSGSPVFNDQWEIVALHHASVPLPALDAGPGPGPGPEPGHAAVGVGGYVNEGIRVSRLVADVRAKAATLAPAGRAVIDAFLASTSDLTAAAPVPSGGAVVAAAPATPVTPVPGVPTTPVTAPFPAAPVTPVVATPGAPVAPVVVTQVVRPPGPISEGIRIDPDYANREGYDPDFLGPDALRVPLPTLPDELAARVAINTHTTREPRYLLPYHHFSVVLHRERRLALLTAVNIDGNTSVRLRREADRWFLDPRVPAGDQTGEDVYHNNALDRGHLVRRLDPAWGSSRAVAKAANDDTFHFTNCTPQHEDFNQNQTTWAGLEDHILENADNRDLRISVVTGPVLADDDPPYKGVLLPRQFWKVVAMVKATPGGGELSVTGYLLSQEELIRGLEVAPDEFSFGAYRTYQVPVRRIEALTRLSFGPLVDADPLARLETTPSAVEILRPDHLVL